MGRFGIPLVILTASLGIVWPGSAGRSEDHFVPGPVPATVIEAIDGDTLEVRARIWPDQTVETSVRLDGIDAPELRGDCADERTLARQARAALAVAAGASVLLLRIRHDKYGGRVVALVQDDYHRDIGARLIAAGLARPYDGGKRQSWCD